MKRVKIFLFSLVLVLIGACGETNKTLPILGNKEEVNGQMVYHEIPDFSFINQDSMPVTIANFAGKAYVSDHFFISCPTICPKLTKSMLRIHDTFKEESNLLLISHSIDTKYDTIPRLKKYANSLGVSSDKWHFVTGEKETIFDIAESYFNIALDDADAPGGYNHSGRLILVDDQRRVRAFCDGTDAKAVDKFMEDIKLLLVEMERESI
ncbi:MAG: SCO family protein [Bacteroidota bacterium]